MFFFIWLWKNYNITISSDHLRFQFGTIPHLELEIWQRQPCIHHIHRHHTIHTRHTPHIRDKTRNETLLGQMRTESSMNGYFCLVS